MPDKSLVPYNERAVELDGEEEDDPYADDKGGPPDRNDNPQGDRKNQPTRMAIIAGAAAVTAVGAVIAAPVVLGAVGFTSAGIAAGSFAASMMSTAAIANGGGVAAGSLVAVLQSAGVIGLSVGAKAAVGIGGGLIGSIFGAKATQKN
ncbi:interferon alpha-inducible protein 27-like protein 1 [Mustelus asterias]